MATDFEKLYQNPDEYDEHTKDLTDDIPFFVCEAEKARGPVLELACGTGRITIPIAKSGVEIVGLDGSAAMLRKAREKSERENLSIEWIQADFRNFSLGRKFKLIFFAYHSLHHINDFESFTRLFRCIREHLADDGSLIIDSWNPGNEGYELQGDPRPPREEVMTFDRLKWFDGDTSQRFDYFYRSEFEKLLTKNGFEVLAQYGDVNRQPYEPHTARIITLARIKHPSWFARLFNRSA